MYKQWGVVVTQGTKEFVFPVKFNQIPFVAQLTKGSQSEKWTPQYGCAVDMITATNCWIATLENNAGGQAMLLVIGK